jgi:DNA-nicking Smr family endonuclease
MTNGRKNRGGGAPADDDLWRQVAGSVKPLGQEKAKKLYRDDSPRSAKAAESRSAKTEPPAGDAPVPVDPASLFRGGSGKPAPAASAFLGLGDSPNVDKRTATKLRRGLLPIEATLDLHGMTLDRARAALGSFLTGHSGAGRRCVLVITGKGLGTRSGDDWRIGAIRSALPDWLNGPDLRPLILSFTQAQPEHGGSGAVYILLRRQR